jgi:transcription antitermination factor NusG
MGVRKRQWPWFAIRVRVGTEKTVNLYLENAGHESFMPVAKCTLRRTDRIEEFEVPLFPGYLFCRMNPQHRLPILQAPGVVQIVGAGEAAIPVKEEEISAIQRIVKSGLASMPWPYLPVGRLAQMEEGPLKGLKGIVVKLKSGMKLVLSVSLLQQSVAVEIDRQWIGDPAAARPAPNRPQSERARTLRIDPRRLEVSENAAVKAVEAD